MTGLELVLLVVMLVGVLGSVVPVLPGAPLVLGALLVWGVQEQTRSGWLVVAACAAVLLAGIVASYAVPGRRLTAAGVPRSTLALGAVVGLVGFFVVPVVGLPLGFVLGVWLAERQRLGAGRAGESTRRALAAVGLSILIEFSVSVLAVGGWLVAVIAT